MVLNSRVVSLLFVLLSPLRILNSTISWQRIYLGLCIPKKLFFFCQYQGEQSTSPCWLLLTDIHGLILLLSVIPPANIGCLKFSRSPPPYGPENVRPFSVVEGFIHLFFLVRQPIADTHYSATHSDLLFYLFP